MIPPGWEVPPLHQLDFVCQFGIPGSICFEQLRPLAPQMCDACPNAGPEMLLHPLRNKKFCILRPSLTSFREPDLFVAEWLTVSRCGVLLVRGTVPDMAVQNDERRTALRLSEDLQRLLNALTIVCVADPQDVPAIGQETSRDILGECQARTPFDRDVVVVVDPAEIVEAQMTGQRCRFRCNTLHQTTISTNGIDAVVEDLEIRLVVSVGKPFLGDRHPDASCDALSQWTGRGLDSRHPVVFRMTGRLAVKLTEPANVVERHRRLSQPFIFGVHGPSAAEMER